MIISRREHERFDLRSYGNPDCDLVQTDCWENHFRGSLIEFSEGGLSIRLDEPPENMEEFDSFLVKTYLPHSNWGVRRVAEIRNLREDQGEGWILGLSWGPESADDIFGSLQRERVERTLVQMRKSVLATLPREHLTPNGKDGKSDADRLAEWAETALGSISEVLGGSEAAAVEVATEDVMLPLQGRPSNCRLLDPDSLDEALQGQIQRSGKHRLEVIVHSKNVPRRFRGRPVVLEHPASRHGTLQRSWVRARFGRLIGPSKWLIGLEWTEEPEETNSWLFSEDD